MVLVFIINLYFRDNNTYIPKLLINSIFDLCGIEFNYLIHIENMLILLA